MVTTTTGKRLMQARERVGRTPEVQAQWLLDFALRDLRRPGGLRRPRDWQRLCEQVLVFARGADKVMRIEVPSLEEVVAAHDHLWVQILSQLRQGQDAELELSKPAPVVLVFRNGVVTDSPTTDGLTLADAFLLRTRATLTAVTAGGRRRLRFCAKPTCGRPFLARRKDAAACSAACSITVRTNRWRAANRERVARAAQRRRRRIGPRS